MMSVSAILPDFARLLGHFCVTAGTVGGPVGTRGPGIQFGRFCGSFSDGTATMATLPPYGSLRDLAALIRGTWRDLEGKES